MENISRKDITLVVLIVAALAFIIKGGYKIDTAITRAQELLSKVSKRGLTGAPEGGFDENAYQNPSRISSNFSEAETGFDAPSGLIGD